jgi:hypothetical protein
MNIRPDPIETESGPEAERKIGDRHGIVSFFSVYGDNNPQGHIAVVSRDRWGTSSVWE